MHFVLFIVHALSLATSFGLMSAALFFGMFGKKYAAFTATLSTVGTAFAGVSGILLLLGAPLSWQGVTLGAYLIAMFALYVFGFGMGIAAEARLIRRPAVQKD